MKKKWISLLLCACMLTSGFQNGNVYAMEEESCTVEYTDSTETDVYELSFDVEKESEYSWVCTSKDLKFCTVERTDSLGENFQVKPVSVGTELLHFSYVDKEGTAKKNVVYKVVVAQDRKMQCIKQSYYSDDVRNSVEDWEEKEGAILVSLMEGRASQNVKIEDYDIVDYSIGHFEKYYNSNGKMLEQNFFRKGAQYILLKPQKEGSTTMAVTYCDVGGSEAKNYKITYQIVVDKELQTTVIPVKYEEAGENSTEGIITRNSNGSAYRWKYEVADEEIANIEEEYFVYFDSTYSDAYDSGKYFGGYFGGGTTYYTVKGKNAGTTYIHFIKSLGEDVETTVWYRIDVDEQKNVTITEIEYSELPADTIMPQDTSNPEIVESSSPDASELPKVTEEPIKTPDDTTFPKATEEPIVSPKVSTSPAVYSETPKATATAMPSTITPTMTVESGTISTEAATSGAIHATEAPKKKSVGTVKIISSVRKSVKKAIVKWKKLAGVKGYQVVIAADKKFLKNVKKKNVSQTKVVLTSLRKGKRYYVKVRAYRIDENGKKAYGQYSDVKVVKKK